MSEMIERVARAICIADCGRVTENELARCMSLARAAIEAMREITADMENAADGSWAFYIQWEKAIDAALSDAPQT